MMTQAATLPADLPDDPHLLRQIIMDQAANLQNQTLVIEKLQLSLLRRQRFGSRNEKLDREIEQLELAIEELEVDSPTGGRTRCGFFS